MHSWPELVLKLSFLTTSWQTPFLPGAPFSYPSLISAWCISTKNLSVSVLFCIAFPRQRAQVSTEAHMNNSCDMPYPHSTQANILAPKLYYDPDTTEPFGQKESRIWVYHAEKSGHRFVCVCLFVISLPPLMGRISLADLFCSWSSSTTWCWEK